MKDSSGAKNNRQLGDESKSLKKEKHANKCSDHFPFTFYLTVNGSKVLKLYKRHRRQEAPEKLCFCCQKTGEPGTCGARV